MTWTEFYNSISTSIFSWLALPPALLIPFWHVRWRGRRKELGKTGDMTEAFLFLLVGVIYFVLAAILFAKADTFSPNGLEIVLIYLFRAGIPIFLLYMLFRQLIDAYF